MQNLGEDIINMYKPYRNTKYTYQKFTLGNQKIQVYNTYQPLDIIGKGAYSVVVAAEDRSKNEGQAQLKAIKKIDKAFEHKIFARRILRQLKLLKLLKHENIIKLQTILLPKSRQSFDDIYLVFDIMHSDLTTILRSKQQLSQQHYQYFLYQILRGLKYIHSAGVVHRDLKPRNLLINNNGDLKICDFGLSRSLDESAKANVLTDYVATRWYRAPELLLGVNDYSSAVDMWSVGCIFAEMLKRKPLLPGSDTKNQLELICQNIEVTKFDNLNLNQKSQKLLKQLLKNKKPRKLENVFEKASPVALDLLKKLLSFDPKQRISAQQALKHPYLSQFHDTQDQPVRQSLNLTQFQYQNYNLTTQQLKDLLYEQILLYHYKNFREDYEKKVMKHESVIQHILNNSNKTNIDPNADYSDEDDD